TNENLLANVNSFCSVVELPKFSKSILSLPLFHSFGQIVLLVCILNHISTIMINHFLPTTILKAIVSHKAEVLPLVPTMFNVLITAAEKKDIDLNFIKFCITGGASIPITLLEKIKTITNARIIEGYGLTETSPVISISDSHYCYKKYSVGKPLPGVQVTIDEDGEIIVRGESVASRYWNNLEETKKSFTEDGYFRTGDIGKIDEDGFVFITDRKKDLIIRAGENISPKIIEDVLFQLQGINDAAVFGVYDEKLGEAIYCAVESEDHIDINYLRQVCKDKLPKHLVPEEFVIMPKLPRNALGKILKFKLRDMFAVAEKVKEPV
ncbi:MAG: AMP-binding protein, partial [Cyanobacteriota bacterium]